MGKHNKSVDVEVSTSSGDAIIASFTNAMQTPETVSLDLYTSTKNPQKSILHGESIDDDLQYDADELDDSQYILGVYDPKNKNIKLIKNTKMFSGRVNANKSLINDAKLVKKLKRKDISTEGTYAERRNALGEEFGTKKAKKAITEAARNKIDAGLLEESQIDIVDGIRQTTKSMPNRDQMAKMVEKENRVIPPCHADATNVEGIYPIEEIVPDEILQCFPIDIFFHNEKEDENENENEDEDKDKDVEKDVLLSKLKYLPYVPAKERGSSHQKKSIFGRLISNVLSERSILSSSSNAHNISDDMRWKLQLISFTSMLVGLYFNRRLNRRDKLMTSYHNVPPSRAINFMLQMFGNSKISSSSFDREIKSFNVGPKEEDKLLCYIIVLLLTLFEFRLELSTLAADLSLKPSKLLALVRTLGCTIMIANKSDGKDAAGSKIAVLRVPFKVPDLVRRFKR
jgi:DNA-directed RNA polymerase I subunit RPA49